MTIMNYVLRFVLRSGISYSGKCLHLCRALRQSQIDAVQEKYFMTSTLCLKVKQKTSSSSSNQTEGKSTSTYVSKETERWDRSEESADEDVPLIVRLLHQNKLKSESEGQNRKQHLSLEQVQKNLEDIKWDTDASAQKDIFEAFSGNSENDLEKEEVPESEIVSDLLSDNFIEDIFIDDDIPQAVALNKSRKKVRVSGLPDPTVPRSNIPCSGCGAALHCQDPVLPGYIPSEKFKCLTHKELETTFCQRCFLINAYNLFLNVRVQSDVYPKILQEIKDTKALVVVVVDLFDMKNSVYKNLLEHIGTNRPLFVVGNKVDLIPRDNPGYLERTMQALLDVCESAGLNPTGKNIKHVCMVSAKTGYGMENLVTKLMTFWQIAGHVYVVGSTNAGKSTLFNALLMSDYCKAVARGFINRATVSVWPGTTLNLLKFPIINPAPWRLMLRRKRLRNDETNFLNEESVRKSRLADLGSYKAAVLTGHIGLTDFRSARAIAEDRAKAEKHEAGQEVVSFSGDEDGFIQEVSLQPKEKYKGPDYKPESYKMYWCHDTPGVVNQEQIINLLQPEELVTILPRSLVCPRCVVVKPGQVLFVTGMGRIDFVQGNKSIYLTSHVALDVKLHVKDKDEADDFYNSALGTAELGVPIGDKERLDKMPSLVGREFHLTGAGWDTATADIQLSSLGWVSVAAGWKMEVTLRAYTPGARGLHLRTPPLLPSYTYFRGKRIGKTPFYRQRQPFF